MVVVLQAIGNVHPLQMGRVPEGALSGMRGAGGRGGTLNERSSYGRW